MQCLETHDILMTAFGIEFVSSGEDRQLLHRSGHLDMYLHTIEILAFKTMRLCFIHRSGVSMKLCYVTDAFCP